MDARRFDAFVRSFPSGSSRRRLLAGVARGLLAAPIAFGSADSSAKNKKKNKGKNKKKTCKGGKQKCGGTCRAKCPAGQVRNPITCGCCIAGSQLCGSQTGAVCCSGQCHPEILLICKALAPGAPCQFDAQCFNGVGGSCDDGACAA